MRKLISRTPTAAAAGFALPHGVAPDAPLNGDVWTTTAGVFARVNGKTVGPLGGGGAGANTGFINFVDAGGVANNDAATTQSANLNLIHNLIAATTVANTGINVNHGLGGPRIYFPPGAYYFSGPIRVRKTCYLMGSDGATRAGHNTIFIFPVDTQGIVLDSDDTDNLVKIVKSSSTPSAAGTTLQGFMVKGSNTGRNTAHGILVRCYAVLKNVGAERFGGHGIHVLADLGDSRGGQASNTQILGCSANDNRLSGLCIAGGDANICNVSGGDYSNNGDWGIQDESFLGNTFSAIHTTGNPNPGLRSEQSVVSHNGVFWALRWTAAGRGGTTTPGTNEDVWTRHTGTYAGAPAWASGGAYRPGGAMVAPGDAQWSVFTGCYSEGQQGPTQLGSKAILIGGDQGAGVVGSNSLNRPPWIDTEFGEIVCRTNFRANGFLYFGKRGRADNTIGFRMNAASAAPTDFAQYEAGDFVFNGTRAAVSGYTVPPLGWRCTEGPGSFEVIPFPSTGSAVASMDKVAFRGSDAHIYWKNAGITSVTRVAVGHYRINLAQARTDYHVTINAAHGGTPVVTTSGNATSTTVDVYAHLVSGAAVDCDFSVGVFV